MQHVRVVEVYQRFEELPSVCRPGWVVREDGATLVTFDPRSIRSDCVAWAVQNLTPDELNYMRAAHDVGPIHTPCPDEWLTDEPVDLYVPPLLRLRPAMAQPWSEVA